MSEEIANQVPNPAEVTYSAADIAAMNLALWKFWLSLIAILAAVLVAVPVVLVVIDGYPLVGSIAAVDWPFTGIVMLFVVIWLIVATVLKYWWSGRSGLLGPIQFSLTREGVSFRNRQVEGVAFWTTIRAVESAGNRVFLFINRRTAFIVPRRAFESDTDFGTFVSEAKRLWESNHAN